MKLAVISAQLSYYYVARDVERFVHDYDFSQWLGTNVRQT